MIFRSPKSRASIWGVLKRCRSNGSRDMTVFVKKKVRIGLFQNDDVLPDFSIWGRGGSQGGSNHMKQLNMGALWCLPSCLDQTFFLRSHFEDIPLCGISAGTDRSFFTPDMSPVWEPSELETWGRRQINRLGLGDSKRLWNRSFGPFWGGKTPKKSFFSPLFGRLWLSCVPRAC